MKRITFVLFALLLSNMSIMSQTKNVKNDKNRTDSCVVALISEIDSLIQINNEYLYRIERENIKERYKLYPTENIYTFLQLDTMTGEIKQVQWSLDYENEFSIVINDKDLSYGYSYGPGNYELYPTKNMYQFILLDKALGFKWHVQWGMDEDKRWIRRIF